MMETHETSYTRLGLDHSQWTLWRGSLDNRKRWQVICSMMLVAVVSYYASLVLDSLVMMIIGGVWCVKLLCEIWGQETPTWACPGSPGVFIAVYIFGLPSFAWMFGSCRQVDINLPNRELVGLGSYLFGSAFSLSYELHRFHWKAKPENKGKLHTIGLAAYCIHPNYFGDLFTYGGWALASGTACALSIVPFQVFLMVYIICPNSDAYLAQKYASEFPAYSSSTASFIPGLRSATLSKVLAWLCLGLAVWMEMNCSASCGL